LGLYKYLTDLVLKRQLNKANKKKRFQSNKTNGKSSSASSYIEDLHVSGQI